MTRNRIITLVVIGAMLIVAGILVLGDLGKTKKAPATSTVYAVAAAVHATGVTVSVSGMHASCDPIADWQQKRQRNLISITPVFERIDDALCDNIIPFDNNVELDVGDLASGTYTIDVLGIITTFVLDKAITSFDFSKLSDATFAQFAIAADMSAKKSVLDTASLVQYGLVQDFNVQWSKATVNAADRLAILTVSCGEQCQQQLVVDISTGYLVHAFQSQFGIIAKPGSLLLIVNDPVAIKASGTTDPVVAEAYLFNPDTRSFDFLAQGDYLFGELHQ